MLLQHKNAFSWTCRCRCLVCIVTDLTRLKNTNTRSSNSLRETICWLTLTKFRPKIISEIFATGLQECWHSKYFLICSKDICARCLCLKFWSSDNFYYSSGSGNGSMERSYGGTLCRCTWSFIFMHKFDTPWRVELVLLMYVSYGILSIVFITLK
jgi:hypothetical protein